MALLYLPALSGACALRWALKRQKALQACSEDSGWMYLPAVCACTVVVAISMGAIAGVFVLVLISTMIAIYMIEADVSVQPGKVRVAKSKTNSTAACVARS